MTIELGLWFANMSIFPSLTITTGMQLWIYARVNFFTGSFSHSCSLLPSAEWSGNQTRLKVLLHTKVHQNVHILAALLTAITYTHELVKSWYGILELGHNQCV